jgi:HSP20 family protein
MSLAPMASRHDRWDPYRDMNERFNRMVQAILGEGNGIWPMAVPPIDIEETEDAYVVDIDLPNVNPSDVELEILGDGLRLTGHRSEREHEGRVRRHDRPSGGFEYLVDLPGEVDPDRIEARYGNGVLTVTAGRTRDAGPRRVEIRTEQPDPT